MRSHTRRSGGHKKRLRSHIQSRLLHSHSSKEGSQKAVAFSHSTVTAWKPCERDFTLLIGLGLRRRVSPQVSPANQNTRRWCELPRPRLDGREARFVAAAPTPVGRKGSPFRLPLPLPKAKSGWDRTAPTVGASTPSIGWDPLSSAAAHGVRLESHPPDWLMELVGVPQWVFTQAPRTNQDAAVTSPRPQLGSTHGRESPRGKPPPCPSESGEPLPS